MAISSTRTLRSRRRKRARAKTPAPTRQHGTTTARAAGESNWIDATAASQRIRINPECMSVNGRGRPEPRLGAAWQQGRSAQAGDHIARRSLLSRRALAHHFLEQLERTLLVAHLFVGAGKLKLGFGFLVVLAGSRL